MTDNIALEGDIVAYSCEVKYKGRWAPVMEWRNNDGVVQANNECSGDIAKYTYVTELTPADNEQVFTCRMYFDQPKPGTMEDKDATNIPSTENVLTNYTSPKLTVYCKYLLYYISKIHYYCMLFNLRNLK